MSEAQVTDDVEQDGGSMRFTASGLIGWTAGAFFVLTAVSLLTVGPLAFAFMSVAAVVTFPPLRKRVITRFGIELSRGLIILLDFVFIVLAGASM